MAMFNSYVTNYQRVTFPKHIKQHSFSVASLFFSSPIFMMVMFEFTGNRDFPVPAYAVHPVQSP